MSDLIKITTKDGKQLVSARELHEFIEIKTDFRKWFPRVCEYGFEESIDYTPVKFIHPRNLQECIDYTISIDMAKVMCLKILSFNRLSKENKHCAINALNYLVTISNKGIKMQIKPRKELEFLDKLKTSLIPFDIKGINQYTVLNYRIDYYIPNLNIAIEYDENDHKNYSYEAQEGRQKEIEKELGCRFIRVSDKNSDEYNIGLVIKGIFNI